MEYVVHARLKCGWVVGELEGHHQELKVPIMEYECHLQNFLLMHLNLVVPRVQLYHREVLGSSKLIHQLIYTGYGLLVLQGLIVQG